MTTPKHTPEPWIAVPNVYHNPLCPDPIRGAESWSIRERSKTGRVVAQITSNIKRPPEEKEANAHLLAAAPKLLAACKEAVDMIEITPDLPEYEKRARIAIIKEARAAIAVAEGVTE